MTLQTIYIRGGDKSAPGVAEAANWLYGVRHDYTPYAPVAMLDIHWKSYRWDDYLSKVRAYAPERAMIADYERRDIRQLYSQISDLERAGTPQILVCPKFPGALDDIPAFCVVALSVPAPEYAGWLPADFARLSGRRIHLLGGKPERQADLICKLAGVDAIVESIDMSYHARKAALGQYFESGRWVDVRRQGFSTVELTIKSARNIAIFLRAAQLWRQAALL